MNGHFKGIVEAIGTGARVKVRIPELDNLITDWLPVGQALTLGARTWAVFREGTQVVVIPGQGLEDAFVSHALYSQVDPAPWEDPLLLGLEADDGTQILYDPAAHTLTITSPQLIDITAATLRLQGDMELTGQLTHQGDTVQTGNVRLVGRATLDQATIASHDFDTHKHTCSSPGSPSGPPLP